MKEKPTENRIFTGSDDELNAEQARNLIKSPEYKKHHEQKVKDMFIIDSPYNQERKIEWEKNQAIELIRATKDGELLANILKCVFHGFTDKKIAKTLMKSERRDVKHFASLNVAIQFVKASREEAVERVKAILAARRVAPVSLN